MISPEQQPWFAALVERSPDAVFLTRPNGEILYANPAACALFGYSLNELQTLGRSAVIDATDPRLPVALEQRSRTGGFAGTLRMVRKGGMAFPAEISSALFRDPAGEECCSVFVRDMSEREGREDALRKANEILAAALAEVKRLQGILPIYSYCKRIRDDQDYWQQVDAYFSSHSSVQFSHGICPACYAEHVEPMIRGLNGESGRALPKLRWTVAGELEAGHLILADRDGANVERTTMSEPGTPSEYLVISRGPSDADLIRPIDPERCDAFAVTAETPGGAKVRT